MGKSSPSSSGQSQRGLRIGAVSRITSIPVDTLRAWERRYQVVEPARSESATRIYSEQNINRLKLIKQLTDRGHAIGSVAELTDSELEHQLTLHGSSAATSNTFEPSQPARMLAFGSLIAGQLQSMSFTRPSAVVLGVHVDWGAFEKQALEHAPQVLIIEVGVLCAEIANDIQRLSCACKPLVVLTIFTYASGETIDALLQAGNKLFKGPMPPKILHALIASELGWLDERARTDALPSNVDDLSRRIDDNELVKLLQVCSAIKCECPRHLADLIIRLSQFETYSANCKNETRDDAVMHEMLIRVTMQARAAVEDALVELAHFENIPLHTR